MFKRIYELNDNVRVMNPMTEDFKFKVGGVEYTIPAGATRTILGYQADQAIKHLVDKIMITEGRTNQLPRSGEAYFWHLDPNSIYVDQNSYSAAMEVFKEIYIGVLSLDELDQSNVPVVRKFNQAHSDMPVAPDAPIVARQVETEVDDRVAALNAMHPHKEPEVAEPKTESDAFAAASAPTTVTPGTTVDGHVNENGDKVVFVDPKPKVKKAKK